MGEAQQAAVSMFKGTPPYLSCPISSDGGGRMCITNDCHPKNLERLRATDANGTELLSETWHDPCQCVRFGPHAMPRLQFESFSRPPYSSPGTFRPECGKIFLRSFFGATHEQGLATPPRRFGGARNRRRQSYFQGCVQSAWKTLKGAVADCFIGSQVGEPSKTAH